LASFKDGDVGVGIFPEGEPATGCRCPLRRLLRRSQRDEGDTYYDQRRYVAQ
jgi:hypothetical protein